ncbi:hypothetical protein M8J76_009092 [Diaphorina citri]|nr:hypothetical protein M8J75_015303 [Diaphorina citri]KAI5709051.1 hypothetical protein M8J76_009092 [Diaphorina citri]
MFFCSEILCSCHQSRHLEHKQPQHLRPATHLWRLFTLCELTENMRQQGDNTFIDLLNALQIGALKPELFTRMILEFLDERDSGGDTTANLQFVEEVDVSYIFLNLPHKKYVIANILRDSDQSDRRAILNVNVKNINERILGMLEGQLHELLSADSVDRRDENSLDADIQIVNQVTNKGVPDHVLRLRIGSVCLIMRNLNIADWSMVPR